MDSKTGFLHLSYEIRRQIYLYYIPTQWLAYFTCNVIRALPGSHLSLLRVSKLISEEALDILYGENLFVLQYWRKPEKYLESITEANRARIRHLVIMPAWPCRHGLSARPSPHDPSLWMPLFANLKQLRLVLGYPRECDGRFTPDENPRRFRVLPWYPYESDPWFTPNGNWFIFWMKPLLECVGQHLSSETVFEAEYNGPKGIVNLVRTLLPDGYQDTRGIWEVDGDLLDRFASFGPRLFPSGAVVPRRNRLFVL